MNKLKPEEVHVRRYMCRGCGRDKGSHKLVLCLSCYMNTDGGFKWFNGNLQEWLMKKTGMPDGVVVS